MKVKQRKNEILSNKISRSNILNLEMSKIAIVYIDILFCTINMKNRFLFLFDVDFTKLRVI